MQTIEVLEEKAGFHNEEVIAFPDLVRTQDYTTTLTEILTFFRIALTNTLYFGLLLFN